MAKNSSGVAAMVRQWHLLRTIPKYPRKISVTEIAAQMSEDGYPVSKRTIQRTLNALSSEFPLCVEESRPHGWSWHKDAPSFNIPRLPVRESRVPPMTDSLGLRIGVPQCDGWCPVLPDTRIGAMSPGRITETDRQAG